MARGAENGNSEWGERIAQEFLRFLRLLDAEFPGKVPLHLIMDNYGTHKHAKVKEWLKRHPRFVPHFVPPVPVG